MSEHFDSPARIAKDIFAYSASTYLAQGLGFVGGVSSLYVGSPLAGEKARRQC